MFVQILFIILFYFIICFYIIKNARDIWLATWSPSDFPEPEASEKDKIREFIKKKYVQKQWYRKPGSAGPPDNASSKKSIRDSRVGYLLYLFYFLYLLFIYFIL